jgi:hypothetical protein
MLLGCWVLPVASLCSGIGVVLVSSFVRHWIFLIEFIIFP